MATATNVSLEKSTLVLIGACLEQVENKNRGGAMNLRRRAGPAAGAGAAPSNQNVFANPFGGQQTDTSSGFDIPEDEPTEPAQTYSSTGINFEEDSPMQEDEGMFVSDPMPTDDSQYNPVPAPQ